MSAKDMILNFLYLAFLIFIVGGAIIFFSQGDNFSTFTKFLRSFWPIASVLAVLAFKLRLTQNEKNRADITGVNLRTLNLSYSDKVKHEIIVFSLPLVVLIIAAFSNDGVTETNIIQAVFVLVIAYAWHKYLWLRAK